jgi:hypothetical protein
MIEPVILTDAILDQAKWWEDDCNHRWTEEGNYLLMGETTVTSPVNGRPRKVVLHLGTFGQVKARTVPGIRSENGGVEEEGYTIILNRGVIDVRLEALIHILLHELTHAVDPEFDRDFQNLNPEGRPSLPLTSEQQYYLASEQRAFTAMWTENLRQDVDQDLYRSPGASILIYRHRSEEFDNYYGHCQLHRHDLMDQTKDHFRRIVEDLKRRKLPSP